MGFRFSLGLGGVQRGLDGLTGEERARLSHESMLAQARFHHSIYIKGLFEEEVQEEVKPNDMINITPETKQITGEDNGKEEQYGKR